MNVCGELGYKGFDLRPVHLTLHVKPRSHDRPGTERTDTIYLHSGIDTLYLSDLMTLDVAEFIENADNKIAVRHLALNQHFFKYV